MYAVRRCSSECSNGKGGAGRRRERGKRAHRVARGKIKGGREVRIRLSQRMLELLSDFLARIMEHSLKKAFARDRDTSVFFFSLPLLLRIHLFFLHAHATPVLFFSFAISHSFC